MLILPVMHMFTGIAMCAFGGSHKGGLAGGRAIGRNFVRGTKRASKQDAPAACHLRLAVWHTSWIPGRCPSALINYRK